MVGIKRLVDAAGNASIEFCKIILKKLISLCLSDLQALLDIGACMPVANGPDTNRVLVGVKTESLKILD